MSRRGRGEGSVTKRRDGRFEARLELGREGGKRRRKTVYGATRAEALAALRVLQAQQQAGTLRTTTRTTMADYLAHWLADVVVPTKRPQTIRDYESVIRARLVPTLGTVPLGQLTPARAQAAFAYLAQHYAPATVHQTYAVLRVALEQAVDWGLIAVNPVLRLRLPKLQPQRPQFFTPDEARRLLAVALTEQEYYGPLYALALTTGLREGELLALRWEDIDDAAGVLSVQRNVGVVRGDRPVRGPKTRAGVRRIPLIAPHRQALLLHARHWGKPEGYLWPGPTGRPLHPESLRAQWYRFLERHGFERRVFHATRHSTASLLVSLGVPINVVAAILGHSSATVTLQVYSHVLPDATADAMAKLEALLHDDPKMPPDAPPL